MSGSGLQEIRRMKKRLDAAFERISSIDSDSLELQADFAKYLCVLVSGYIERAIAQVVQEHARQCGSPSLYKYVESNTNRFSNAKPHKIIGLMGSFSKEWKHELEKLLTDDQKEAISSIVNNRHQIAHGRDSRITYHEVHDYYKKSQDLLTQVENLCLRRSSV